MNPRKAIAALVAGMISIAFWTVAVVTFWKGTFTPEALAPLATSTTTLAAAFAAALIPDKMESAERKRLDEDLGEVMELRKAMLQHAQLSNGSGNTPEKQRAPGSSV